MVKDQKNHHQKKIKRSTANNRGGELQVRPRWRHSNCQKFFIVRQVLKGTKTKNSGMCVYAMGYFTSGRTHLDVQGSIYPVIISREIHQRMYFVIDTLQIF